MPCKFSTNVLYVLIKNMDNNKKMANLIQQNAKRRWWARTVRLDAPEAKAFERIARQQGVSIQILFERAARKEIEAYEKNMAAT